MKREKIGQNQVLEAIMAESFQMWQKTSSFRFRNYYELQVELTTKKTKPEHIIIQLQTYTQIRVYQ